MTRCLSVLLLPIAIYPPYLCTPDVLSTSTHTHRTHDEAKRVTVTVKGNAKAKVGSCGVEWKWGCISLQAGPVSCQKERCHLFRTEME